MKNLIGATLFTLLLIGIGVSFYRDSYEFVIAIIIGTLLGALI